MSTSRHGLAIALILILMVPAGVDHAQTALVAGSEPDQSPDTSGVVPPEPQPQPRLHNAEIRSASLAAN